MTLDAAALQRLSALLDEALDLPEAGREAWLASLSGEAATLGPTLRKVLLGATSKETGDLLARGPVFPAPVEAPGGMAAAPDFVAGDTVGLYRLLRALGRGGMGEVWLAERSDGQLRRTLALKLPALGLRRSVLVQRFARERDFLGSLVHPNIARLCYDAGPAEDRRPRLALETVADRPITQYCGAERVNLRACVQLLMQVAQEVQYAHANLVIHRDLKPGNVRARADSQAMLLDFGIAKLIEEERSEAAETELTRVGGRALEVEDAVLHCEPARPAGVPADLATQVLKALKKPPALGRAEGDFAGRHVEDGALNTMALLIGAWIGEVDVYRWPHEFPAPACFAGGCPVSRGGCVLPDTGAAMPVALAHWRTRHDPEHPFRLAHRAAGSCAGAGTGCTLRTGYCGGRRPVFCRRDGRLRGQSLGAELRRAGHAGRPRPLRGGTRSLADAPLGTAPVRPGVPSQRGAVGALAAIGLVRRSQRGGRCTVHRGRKGPLSRARGAGSAAPAGGPKC